MRTGYSFLGWTYEGQTTPIKSVRVEKGTIGNKTYTANWQANTYIVALDADGGTVSQGSVHAIYDSHCTLPTPEREGYEFGGWYNGGKQYTSGTWTTGKNITLKATWSAKSFQANYNANGGTFSAAHSNFTYDSDYTLLEPTREGYRFIEWQMNGIVVPLTGTWKYNNDVSLTAVWEQRTYTITYDAGVGTASKISDTATYDDFFTLATAERVGYIFDGWYYEGERVYDGDWKIAGNVTLVAAWTARRDTKYVVNHYKQNVNNDEYTIDLSENLEGTSDASVTPDVKSFTGFTSPSTQTVTIKPDGTRVVDYYYTRNSYTITLITNGGTGTEITQKYQSALTPDTWTTRDGYTFGGWFTDVNLTESYYEPTMPASNTTVYAWWTEENKPSDFTYSGTTSITINSYVGTSTTMWIPEFIGGVSVTTIPKSAFENKTELIKVVIPESVTSIGKSALNGLNKLEELTIPFIGNSLTSTGRDAVLGSIFKEYGINISSASYDSYEGKYVLQYTYREYSWLYYTYYDIPKSLKSVTITVQTELPANAFRNCDFIETFNIHPETTAILKYTFAGCDMIKDLDFLPDSVTSIGDYSFSECLGLIDVKIADTITSIGGYAFMECKNLARVTMTDSVVSIGTRAFLRCSNLKEVVLSNNITTIEYGTFWYCDSLQSITITENVTSIGTFAFGNCSKLISITIPDSVTRIDGQAIIYCSSLETVYYTGSADEWDSISIGSGNTSLESATIVYDCIELCCELNDLNI